MQGAFQSDQLVPPEKDLSGTFAPGRGSCLSQNIRDRIGELTTAYAALNRLQDFVGKSAEMFDTNEIINTIRGIGPLQPEQETDDSSMTIQQPRTGYIAAHG